MRMRPAHLVLCGALFLAPLAACGSDDKSDTKTDDTSDATTSTKADATDSGNLGAGDNAELEAYCKDVGAYVESAQEFLAGDPQHDTAGLEALQSEGDELSEHGAKLTPTLDQSDTAQLVECSKGLQTLAADFAAAYSKGMTG